MVKTVKYQFNTSLSWKERWRLLLADIAELTEVEAGWGLSN